MTVFSSPTPPAQHFVQCQLRVELLQGTPEQAAGGHAQQRFECGVQRLHDALVVHGCNAGGNVLQHGVQVPALGQFAALAVQDAKGFFQGFAHGGLAD